MDNDRLRSPLVADASFASDAYADAYADASFASDDPYYDASDPDRLGYLESRHQARFMLSSRKALHDTEVLRRREESRHARRAHLTRDDEAEQAALSGRTMEPGAHYRYQESMRLEREAQQLGEARERRRGQLERQRAIFERRRNLELQKTGGDAPPPMRSPRRRQRGGGGAGESRGGSGGRRRGAGGGSGSGSASSPRSRSPRRWEQGQGQGQGQDRGRRERQQGRSVSPRPIPMVKKKMESSLYKSAARLSPGNWEEPPQSSRLPPNFFFSSVRNASCFSKSGLRSIPTNSCTSSALD